MSLVMDKIAKRVTERNQNFLAVFCGATGSGKSYGSLKFAEDLAEKTGTKFNIRNITFEPHEFMELVNGDLPRGSVIIFDEVGTGLDAKKWYSAINILIGYTLQTFRRQNLIVLFTTPDFGFIDSSARKLLHAYFETLKIDYRAKQCVIKPYLIQNNPRYSKQYFKYPRMIINDRMRVIRRMRVGLPSQDLIDKYEEKKREFTEELNAKVMRGIKGLSTLPTNKLTQVERSVHKLNKQGMTQKQISGLLNIHQSAVSSTLKRVEKKGYEVQRHITQKAKRLEDITPMTGK